MNTGASHNGTGQHGEAFEPMPTLFRFLSVILFIAGMVYGAMYALVVYVEPKKGEIMVRVPPEKLKLE